MEVEEVIEILLNGGSVDGDIMDEFAEEIDENIFICEECDNWCYRDNESSTHKGSCMQCFPMEGEEVKNNAFD